MLKNRRIYLLAALVLTLGLLLCGCGQEPEENAAEEDQAAAAVPQDEAAADETAAEMSDGTADAATAVTEDVNSPTASLASTDGFVAQIIGICEDHGVGLTFSAFRQDIAVFTGAETVSWRTICDSIDGEREPSFQIIVDDYQDRDLVAEEFRLMKEQQENYARETSVTQVLMDDGDSFASYMDASGTTSNFNYFKLCQHYIVTIAAMPAEYFDTAVDIMNEIEAVTGQ